jgi:hypothetical protein
MNRTRHRQRAGSRIGPSERTRRCWLGIAEACSCSHHRSLAHGHHTRPPAAQAPAHTRRKVGQAGFLFRGSCYTLTTHTALSRKTPPRWRPILTHRTDWTVGRRACYHQIGRTTLYRMWKKLRNAAANQMLRVEASITTGDWPSFLQARLGLASDERVISCTGSHSARAPSPGPFRCP